MPKLAKSNQEGMHVSRKLGGKESSRLQINAAGRPNEDWSFIAHDRIRATAPEVHKTLSGFGNARIHEIRQNDRSGTFRVVYTTIVKDKIYVLHAFQKKSNRRIETPKEEMDLIRKRLEELKSV